MFSGVTLLIDDSSLTSGVVGSAFDSYTKNLFIEIQSRNPTDLPEALSCFYVEHVSWASPTPCDGQRCDSAASTTNSALARNRNLKHRI